MPTRGAGFEEPFDELADIQRTNHLLVIGIDDYAHCPRLYNCVKDAQDFITVLKKRFLFEEANITTIFNQMRFNSSGFYPERDKRAELIPRWLCLGVIH